MTREKAIPINRCFDGKWICNKCIDADIVEARDYVKDALKVQFEFDPILEENQKKIMKRYEPITFIKGKIK